MDSLACTLYVALVIAVWQLTSSSNNTVIATPAAFVVSSSVRDDRFVAIRYDVPVPDALDVPDSTGDKVDGDAGAGHRHQFLESTAALATELHCFGWIQRLPQSAFAVDHESEDEAGVVPLLPAREDPLPLPSLPRALGAHVPSETHVLYGGAASLR